MRKIIYLILLLFITTSCGKKDENGNTNIDDIGTKLVKCSDISGAKTLFTTEISAENKSKANSENDITNLFSIDANGKTGEVIFKDNDGVIVKTNTIFIRNLSPNLVILGIRIKKDKNNNSAGQIEADELFSQFIIVRKSDNKIFDVPMEYGTHFMQLVGDHNERYLHVNLQNDKSGSVYIRPYKIFEQEGQLIVQKPLPEDLFGSRIHGMGEWSVDLNGNILFLENRGNVWCKKISSEYITSALNISGWDELFYFSNSHYFIDNNYSNTPGELRKINIIDDKISMDEKIITDFNEKILSFKITENQIVAVTATKLITIYPDDKVETLDFEKLIVPSATGYLISNYNYYKYNHRLEIKRLNFNDGNVYNVFDGFDDSKYDIREIRVSSDDSIISLSLFDLSNGMTVMGEIKNGVFKIVKNIDNTQKVHILEVLN